MSPDSINQLPQILYIDDDPVNRSLVNRVLTNYNFVVTEADTGIQGLQIAQKNRPDLVLMDINMPGLDGHETTTRMRSIRGLEQTPIVAVTANVTRGAREMALAAGCDGYIPKPIDIDNFPLQVIAYLEGQKDTMSSDEREHYLGKYSQRLVARLETKIMELQEANARLQKIDKLKTDFITVAAHELRTPITLVYGYARLLQSQVDDRTPSEISYDSVSDLSGRIYQSVHRLSEVVNDILNFSLIETNQMELETTEVQIGSIIDAALIELELHKKDRQLTITTNALDDLPPVICDPARLQQAFWNILSNAIKFTPDQGTIEIEGRVATLEKDAGDTESSNQKEPASLIITIKDSGIGIDRSEQKEIFGRFYMIDDISYHSSSKTAFRGGGLGLGLPIAKGIIQAHGGRIWVESAGRNLDENPGSTFFVLLPLNVARY